MYFYSSNIGPPGPGPSWSLCWYDQLKKQIFTLCCKRWRSFFDFWSISLRISAPYPFSNISEATVRFESMFNVEFLWVKATNICSDGLSHMIKMAVMTLYGKNLFIFFSWISRKMALKRYQQLGPYKWPGISLDLITARSILMHNTFVWDS